MRDLETCPGPARAPSCPARAERLPCTTPGCTLPFARVEGDVLVIESWHHGRKHTNHLSLTRLRALLACADPGGAANGMGV